MNMNDFNKVQNDTLNGWELFMKDGECTERILKTARILTEGCDNAIGMCVLGEGAYVAMLIEEFDDLGHAIQKAREEMKKIYPPDFGFLALDHFQSGAVITMADALWQVIPPEEVILNEKNSLDISCALENRMILMTQCEAGEVHGLLLPGNRKQAASGAAAITDSPKNGPVH